MEPLSRIQPPASAAEVSRVRAPQRDGRRGRGRAFLEQLESRPADEPEPEAPAPPAPRPHPSDADPLVGGTLDVLA